MVISCALENVAVIPILVGPIQVLLAVLPAIIVALFGVLFSLFRPSVMKMAAKLAWRLKVYLIAAILLVAGSIWGFRTLAPGQNPVIPAGDCTGEWPLSRGGLNRSGAATEEEGPVGQGIQWTHKEGRNEEFLSSAALVGGRVYVASARTGVYSRGGSIYCFDGETGEVLWRGGPDGYLPTFSSPSISGRFLVCGEGLHDTRCARVICLDLTPGKEGNVLWTYETKSHVECTPVICNGRVYVGAGDDGYYCFELAPGPDGKAQLVWHLPGEDYPDAETSLVVHDGKVYAGLGMNGLAMCVLDAGTGKELQRVETPYPVFSPPSISGGKLYFGMGNGDYIRSAESIRDAEIALRKDEFDEVELRIVAQELAPGGEVWCVDLETMQVDWNYRLDRTVLGCVAAVDDSLYFGSRDKYVYRLDKTGELKARRNLHATVLTSPAVTRNHVYVITDAGILYALDREDLSIEWETVVGANGVFVSSPAVAEGRLYVGTQKNGFVCVGGSLAEDTTPVWAGVHGDAAVAGKKKALLPLTGTVRWKDPGDGNIPARITAPIMVTEERVYLPTVTEAEHGLVIRKVEKDTNDATSELMLITINPIYHSPARVGDRIMMVDGKPGDTDRHLSISDPPGMSQQEIPIEDKASGIFTVSSTHIYLQDTEKDITCLDLEGKRIWSQPVGNLDSTPTIAGPILVLMLSEPGTMIALDTLTGMELWKRDITSCETHAVTHENRIYVGTANGLAAFSLITGEPIDGWACEGARVTAAPVIMQEAIICVTEQGELLVLDSESGKTLRRVKGVDPGTSPVVSQGRVLYMGMGALMTVDLEDEKSGPVSWMDMSGLGRPNTPILLKESRLYMGTTKGGPVCLGARQ